MKKIFTLLLGAMMSLTGMAQTAADLVGHYVSTYSWTDKWGDQNGPKTAAVTIKMDEAGNLVLSNIANMGGSVTAAYDAASKTITLTGQEVSGYQFCTYPTLGTDVVATVADNGEINFANVGIGRMDGDNEDWYYRDLSTSLKKLNPTSTVEAEYILGDGAIIKGTTTVEFYSIEECDYDFGFELFGDLVLVYKDNGELEITSDAFEDVNPAEEYSKLELSASNWWGDTFWTMGGDHESGYMTLRGEYYTESGWLADPVVTADFALIWGGWSNVSAVKADQSNAPIYNAAGQRVNAGTRGLVIKAGKKMMNK